MQNHIEIVQFERLGRNTTEITETFLKWPRARNGRNGNWLRCCDVIIGVLIFCAWSIVWDFLAIYREFLHFSLLFSLQQRLRTLNLWFST